MQSFHYDVLDVASRSKHEAPGHRGRAPRRLVIAAVAALVILGGGALAAMAAVDAPLLPYPESVAEQPAIAEPVGPEQITSTSPLVAEPVGPERITSTGPAPVDGSVSPPEGPVSSNPFVGRGDPARLKAGS